MSNTKPKVAMVLCAVLEGEFDALARSRSNVVHKVVLKQGLHNTPPQLQAALQEAVTQIEASGLDVEAIVLGYGLCSRGAEGITSRKYKLVLPRAHDCITLLLGSKERYAAYVKEHPGCYWYSPGWISDHELPGPERYNTMRRKYVEQYGEENADFLMESEQAWYQNYSLGAYVDTGLTDPAGVECDIAYTKRCTEWLKWNFERVHGSPALMEALLDGRWSDADFLVLEPGQSAKMVADERVVTVVRLPDGQKVVV